MANKTSTPQKLNKILTKELKDFLAGKVTNTHARTVSRLSDAIMRTMVI